MWDHVNPKAVFISDLSEIGKKALRFNKTKTPIYFINCKAPKHLLDNEENVFQLELDPNDYINDAVYSKLEPEEILRSDILIINTENDPTLISSVNELVENYNVLIVGNGPKLPNFIGYFTQNDIMKLVSSTKMCYTKDMEFIKVLQILDIPVIDDLNALSILPRQKFNTYKEFLIDSCNICSFFSL